MSADLSPRTIKIAKYSKWLNVSALVWFISYAIQADEQTDPDTAMGMLGLKLILLLVAVLLFLYSTTRLSLAFGGHYRFFPLAIIVLIGLAFLSAELFYLLPLGCLVILVLLTWATREELMKTNLRMGLLGAKNVTLSGRVKNR